MIQTITAQDIQKLQIFETFNRTDRLMALKAFNVQVVNQGMIIYRNSKAVDPRVIGRNYRVLKELIEKEEEQVT
jgi:hypothetical protein